MSKLRLLCLDGRATPSLPALPGPWPLAPGPCSYQPRPRLCDGGDQPLELQPRIAAAAPLAQAIDDGGFAEAALPVNGIAARERLAIQALARRPYAFRAERGREILCVGQAHNDLQLVQYPAHQPGNLLAFGAQTGQNAQRPRSVSGQRCIGEAEY